MQYKTHDHYLDIWKILILAGLSFFSVGIYLLASHLEYRTGFPLDDAWIHQTFARNLAWRGEWAFLPGHISGGSTSPLWSILLSVGYWLRISPYLWTFGWGILILLGLSLVGEMVALQIVPNYRCRFPWVGAFLAGEWHLVWAASSGMETALHALLVTSILYMLLPSKRDYLRSGALIGLSIWIRPDGVTLLGPVLLVIALAENTLKKRFRGLFDLFLGFGPFFILYIFFNLALTDTPWPSTFYAKQAEYAALLALPLWRRFLVEVSLPLIGAGVLLVPGVIIRLIKAVQKRDWVTTAVIFWLMGFIFLYATRLPVTYQHGRYIIPAMPTFFIWGLGGVFEFLTQANRGRWHQVVGTVAKYSITLTLVGFWIIGAKTYADDVSIIESEMVRTALWIADYLPPDALIAAHDIGALGYFGRHELIDLAGLVSPEVVPFLRDESWLASYLDQRGADYLVAFPSWYKGLTSNATVIYNTGSRIAPSLGGENLVVYKWSEP